MDLPNGVKAEKSRTLFLEARQGSYLMERDGSEALKTLELPTTPVNLSWQLCSAFRGDLHYQYQVELTAPALSGSHRPIYRDFAMSVVQSISVRFSSGEINVPGQ